MVTIATWKLVWVLISVFITGVMYGSKHPVFNVLDEDDYDDDEIIL